MIFFRLSQNPILRVWVESLVEQLPVSFLWLLELELATSKWMKTWESESLIWYYWLIWSELKTREQWIVMKGMILLWSRYVCDCIDIHEDCGRQWWKWNRSRNHRKSSRFLTIALGFSRYVPLREYRLWLVRPLEEPMVRFPGLDENRMKVMFSIFSLTFALNR